MSVAKFLTHKDRVTVALSAIEATMFGPTELKGQVLLSVCLANPGGETITGRLLAGDGTNFAEEPWDGLKSIGPGEVRRVEFNIAGCKYIKLVATATGATNVTLSVYSHTHP